MPSRSIDVAFVRWSVICKQ